MKKSGNWKDKNNLPSYDREEEDETLNFGDDFEDEIKHGNDDLVGSDDQYAIDDQDIETPSDIIKSIK